MKYLAVICLITLVYSSCKLDPNRLEAINGELKLLKQVTNGQKFLVGDLASTNYLYVAKLKGTHYEMGKAFGEMFKEEIKIQLAAFFVYVQDTLKSAIGTKLPKFVTQPAIKGAVVLVKKLLALNVIITKKYTNPRYYQEIKGIAAGAQMKAQEIKELNVFPELIKAACTVAGLWGPATQNNHTLHMRALDWAAQCPISRYPIAVSYFPSDKTLHPHVNFAWVGFVGSLTGISDKVAIGQKVWLPREFVRMTRYGNPWTYVFRDVLYEANNITSALDILSNTHRTCAIHIGLSGVDDHSFRMLEYAFKTLNVYDDKNYTFTKNHPKIDGVAFFDKHVQPSGDECVAMLLRDPQFYKHWDIDAFWRVVGHSHTTGDTQLVVFDLEGKKTYVAYSEYREDGKNPTPAYARPPIVLDTEELLTSF